MALYTREEVLDEAKKLAHMLSNIEEINRFKVIEAKINRNERLQSLIKKLKVLQKQAVNLEAYEKKKALEIVETEIKKIEDEIDRKSTRLNSSHVAISYAVFCLKKKT